MKDRLEQLKAVRYFFLLMIYVELLFYYYTHGGLRTDLLLFDLFLEGPELDNID